MRNYDSDPKDYKQTTVVLSGLSDFVLPLQTKWDPLKIRNSAIRSLFPFTEVLCKSTFFVIVD